MPVLLLLLLLIVLSIPLPAQFSDSAYDARIERSLSLFDLKPWIGTQPAARPRLGLYTNPLPFDTLWRSAGVPEGTRGNRIWHLMPHWPADEGGLFIGDIIIGMNGGPIGDSIYQNDDYINIRVREMNEGDSARFRVIRNARMIDIPIRLATARPAPMPLVAKPRFDRERGESWLRRTIDAHGIDSWTATVRRQMLLVADLDFSTVQFAGRPSPFRLNDITYLHHYPTRVGALSRSIVQDLWSPLHRGEGLRGALAAAAEHLDIVAQRVPSAALPKSPVELEAFAAVVQSSLDRAYRPVATQLDSLTAGLLRVLSMESNWESELDSIDDPRERRTKRTTEENRLAGHLAAGDRVQLGDLLQAGERLALLGDSAWLRSFATAASTWKGRRLTRVAGIEGDIVYSWMTPQGLFVIGGAGPNRYSADIRFLVDMGGDDHYDLPALRPGTFRYVGDISGNDIYQSSASGVGAGVGGLDMLVDLSGNDTYRAEHYAQGAGLLGIGILADYAGDDIYVARSCSQGAAFLGIGMLYDAAGNDLYTSEVYSQGFGFTKGFGVILESGGNDSYRAGWKHPDFRYPGRSFLAMSQGFGFGLRPWSTGVGTDGGIGVLTDLAGSDLYASDYFSQGGSYWYALGILHDGEGADRYTAGQYSQGSGIHLAFGALLDDTGDDMYDAYAGLEQGNAHDWSSGCLEDLAGNDTYRGSTSSQGSALTVAYAWLLDEGGDDIYYSHPRDTTHSQGGGNRHPSREGGSLGILLDMGLGRDYYTEMRATPGSVLVKSNGLLYDDGEPDARGE